MKHMNNMDNRYFFVSFSHIKGFGNTYLSTSHGDYVNLVALKNYIEKDIKDVVIINIIEMSENDYNLFIRKDVQY